MAQNIPVIRELPVQPYRPLPVTQNIPIIRQLAMHGYTPPATTTTTTPATQPAIGNYVAPDVRKNAGLFSPSGILSIFSPSNKGTKQGVKQSAPAIAPVDKGMALLEGLGIHGQEAADLLAQVNRAGQIAKLPAEFQGPVQSYFDAQAAKQKQQPLVDPLTMQMFFGSQIAPYIQQFAANTQQQVGQGYDTLMANLPRDKFTASLLRDLIPQEKAAAVGEAQANANAIGPAAQLNAIMQQLAQSQQTQLAMNADLRNQATLGLLGGQAGAFSAPAKSGG